MRQRLALAALTAAFAATFAITGNATAATAVSSSPETTTLQSGWTWPE